MTDSLLVRATLAMLVCVSTLLASPASTLAGGFDARPPRSCGSAPCRRPPPPPGSAYGPPRIVHGYLPRNHALPMYNEPPARPPAW